MRASPAVVSKDELDRIRKMANCPVKKPKISDRRTKIPTKGGKGKLKGKEAVLQKPPPDPVVEKDEETMKPTVTHISTYMKTVDVPANTEEEKEARRRIRELSRDMSELRQQRQSELRAMQNQAMCTIRVSNRQGAWEGY